MSRRKPYVFTESSGAPKIWRNLEDKDLDPKVLQEMAEEERPGGFVAAAQLVEKSRLGRRDFLAVTGATSAMMVFEGCVRRPVEPILPYANSPEHLVPGIPVHFATVTQREGDALGLLVTSHDGRPTKVEGNPNHPASQGATDTLAQILVNSVYDPDRSQKPAKREGGALVDASYAEFAKAFEALIAEHRATQGAGLRFLVQPSTSPTFHRLRQAVRSRLPQARFHVYSSVNMSNAREGARIAFGRPHTALIDFEKAQVVLALDSDFLHNEPFSTRYSRAFAKRRAVESPETQMNRLYVVEPGHSATGAAADHRLRLPASQVGNYLLALAKVLVQKHSIPLAALEGGLRTTPTDFPKEWLEAVADDLAANRGRAPIVVGRNQPAWVHALAHAVNAGLGNHGQCVRFFPAIDTNEPTDLVADLKELVEATDVKTVVIIGGNPVYDAPADFDFAGFLGREGLTSVHFSSHRDETSQLATWHCPLANELESWGDLLAVDGTYSIQQPLIAPLYDGWSPLQVLAVAADRKESPYELVRETVRARYPSAAFERDFRKLLHAGVKEGTTVTGMTGAPLFHNEIAQAIGSAKAVPVVSKDSLEISFRPDPALWEGRYANDLWALELPDPMTKIVWDNAALISVQTARDLGLRSGQMVKLTVGERSLEVPVWILPGHADGCVTLTLGWGRKAAGRYGSGFGFDAQKIRTSQNFFFAGEAKLEKLGKTYTLVQTQTHDRMEGRPIAIDLTFDEYKARPNEPSFRAVEFVNTPPLWKEVEYRDQRSNPGEKDLPEVRYRWGMTLDLTTCTGCNACVVACQAENNIPSVGKRGVEQGREMYWLRLDRYFVGEYEHEPLVAIQPVACQQCEEAPCENVCPVNATTHSPEGLNDMAYNRCIGTRYCANNCPYKVRRFNYLDWHSRPDELADEWSGKTPHGYRPYGDFPESRKLQFNPNVTVRMRGVMEKCTYCVQRIEAAKIEARREDRIVRDGDVVTACQQACSNGSIVFGDLNDPNSRVSKLVARDHTYKLLAEIGTQPRTTYLAKIRNPNPAMLKSNSPSSQETH
ncbi:MAG: 4Fe-4S dicluster domain-containing protein [Myxococcales bacterium]|nr:4Fe-4S dicluster domain-containing protein [Myxococcales bacterium]